MEVILKMPDCRAFDDMIIKLWNHTDRPVRFMQKKPRFENGKWIVDVYLLEVDGLLKLRGPDNRPGA